MKYAELAKKTPEELKKMEQELRLELMKHKALLASGAPGKEAGKVREIKRSIARVLMAQGGARKG